VSCVLQHDMTCVCVLCFTASHDLCVSCVLQHDMTCVCVCVGVSMFEEEDEPLVDAALAGDVFTFIRNCIIANADFHREVSQHFANTSAA